MDAGSFSPETVFVTALLNQWQLPHRGSSIILIHFSDEDFQRFLLNTIYCEIDVGVSYGLLMEVNSKLVLSIHGPCLIDYKNKQLETMNKQA